MKRTFLLIVLCILSISLLASCNLFSTSQDDGSEYIDRFEYIQLPDGTYSIKAGDTIDLEKIIIPAEYEGIAVTQISNEAFLGAENLTDVAIPDSITHIGQSAFKECMQLKAVRFEENSSLKTIGGEAFSNCMTLLHINLPEGLIEIGDKAFYNCISMSNITIPSTLEKAGKEVFAFCRNLYKFTNKSSTEISFLTAFGQPDYYVKVHIDKDGNVKYQDTNSTKWIMTDDDFLFRSSEGAYTLVAYVGSNETVTLPLDYDGNTYKYVRVYGIRNVIIPEGFTTIDEQGFMSCDSLESVVFPKSLTSIGKDAFSGCISLKKVVIPGNVTSITPSAFIACKRLSSIEVDKSNPNYKSVDGNLYSKDGKTLLIYAIAKEDKQFTIPDGVQEIGAYAFTWSENLENVTIRNGVTSIGQSAFYNSTIKRVDLPDTITHIGDYAFSNCRELEGVVLPDGLTHIGNSVFDSCSGIKEITIPDSVVSIGERAFRATSITHLTIPDGVTELGRAVFSDCGYLTDAVIGNGVTSIPTEAFLRCYALESIVVPKSVTSIGIAAFDECRKLTDVYYTGTESDWKYVSIKRTNDYFKSATKHFDYIPEK